jgi:hypothetical protein
MTKITKINSPVKPVFLKSLSKGEAFIVPEWGDETVWINVGEEYVGFGNIKYIRCIRIEEEGNEVDGIEPDAKVIPIHIEEIVFQEILNG